MSATGDNWLLVSDLDGTLLDHHTYSWESARPALDYLRERGIPVALNSSKSANEIEVIREDMALGGPFIAENGSAVFLPRTDFPDAPEGCSASGNYWCKLFGRARADIVELLTGWRAGKGWQFAGFSDWDAEDIATITGLSVAAAERASRREFSEPLLWRDSPAALETFRQQVLASGLQFIRGGRFIHILGPADKGRATAWMRQQYQQKSGGKLRLVALGDGPNDIDLFRVADIAVVVKSPAYPYPPFTSPAEIIYTDSFGPAGWNEAVFALRESHKL